MLKFQMHNLYKEDIFLKRPKILALWLSASERVHWVTRVVGRSDIPGIGWKWLSSLWIKLDCWKHSHDNLMIKHSFVELGVKVWKYFTSNRLEAYSTQLCNDSSQEHNLKRISTWLVSDEIFLDYLKVSKMLNFSSMQQRLTLYFKSHVIIF